MTITHSILDLIGNTPMIQVNNFDTGPCELFIKCEFANPGGSIKDRIALHMINCAEKSGQLKPGDTIIEATAGNTGLGLALTAAKKKYPLIIVMPDKMGKEKITHLRAMGAKVIITRSDVEKGHPEYYQDLAERLATEHPHSFYVNQFANEDNPPTHELSTGPEIWQQMAGQIDAFVFGIGSSGSLTGIGRYLRQKNPDIDLILADPQGSILAERVNHDQTIMAGKWLVEGIGEDFVPNICDLEQITQAYTVSDKDSFNSARELLRQEGIFAGSSTGTCLHAALQYCQEQTTAKRVVTIAGDTGNKYLAKLYNDEWLWQYGFIKRPTENNLRDLIARAHDQSLSITLQPHESISNALKHFTNHAISQCPVLADQKLVGLITESAVLQAMSIHTDFEQPVEDIMQKDFPILAVDQSLVTLITQLEQHNAIAITENDQFLGLISRIDVIHYLNRSHPS